MNLLLTLRVALRALGKNKMRAGLTVLGVVIGISAVTAMVSVGQSASGLIQNQFTNLGTNVLVIFPDSQRTGGVHQGHGSSPTLTADDCDAITRECKTILAVSPIVIASKQLVYENINWKPRELGGVGPGYLIVRNWQLRQGGFFTDQDVKSANTVCVIGQTVAQKLFQTNSPLNKTIRIGDHQFTVIGVLEKRGADLVGNDQDDLVVAPYTTVQRRLQRSTFSNVDFILASARSVANMSEAEDEIRQLLAQQHHIRPGEVNDFAVQNMSQVAAIFDIITGVMTLLLSSIAGISLLVGGVGIMNIMLVSVTERTREIGIRMAVGARSRDILAQFLVEAVVLSSLGGLVGITLGVGASMGITLIINSLTQGAHWPTVISLPAAIIAMLFAGAVGVAFGFYPAWKASHLDPIEALRYE